jgi:hypothetical protein
VLSRTFVITENKVPLPPPVGSPQPGFMTARLWDWGNLSPPMRSDGHGVEQRDSDSCAATGPQPHTVVAMAVRRRGANLRDGLRCGGRLIRGSDRPWWTAVVALTTIACFCALAHVSFGRGNDAGDVDEGALGAGRGMDGERTLELVEQRLDASIVPEDRAEASAQGWSRAQVLAVREGSAGSTLAKRAAASATARNARCLPAHAFGQARICVPLCRLPLRTRCQQRCVCMRLYAPRGNDVLDLNTGPRGWCCCGRSCNI